MSGARWIHVAGALVIAVSSGALAHRSAAQEPPALAIVNATVDNGDGVRIEGATIVVSRGRITAVGPGLAAPAGATVVDAAGGVVTYGLTAVCTPLGLVEISLEEEANDESAEGDAADPVRAAFSAADGVNPRSTLVPIARREGVASAVAAPVGGLVSGTSAWVDLAGETPDEMIARDVVGLHVNLNEGGVRAAGGAMPLAITRLRELLDDARLYARQRAAFDRRALREMRVSRLDLERIAEALAGRIPIVVTVSRAADILRVLDLAREQRFRLVLEGAEEGHRVAAAIAGANVPVIVRPHQNLPSTFARLGTRFDNAALLAGAGVRIVIAPTGAHEARTLRQEVGNAIAWGLDRDVALRAVTSEPARVFGLDRDYGRIARGRVANLVVWTGDPFELGTWASEVVVRGRRVSLATRQTELFERYRNLDGVPRGFPRARQ